MDWFFDVSASILVAAVYVGFFVILFLVIRLLVYATRRVKGTDQHKDPVPQ